MGSIKDQSIPIKKTGKKPSSFGGTATLRPTTTRPPPPPRWVQQFTVSSFLPAALCVFLCFSYRRHVAPRQEPPPSAGACCPSPQLISPRTPPPPSTRLSCRLSGRDGRVPAGRRPASSALATSLRANTLLSPHSGASRGTARLTRPPWQWKFTGWQRWEVMEYKYFITVLECTFQALFKVKKSKSKSIFSHVQDIQKTYKFGFPLSHGEDWMDDFLLLLSTFAHKFL